MSRKYVPPALRNQQQTTTTPTSSFSSEKNLNGGYQNGGQANGASHQSYGNSSQQNLSNNGLFGNSSGGKSNPFGSNKRTAFNWGAQESRPRYDNGRERYTRKEDTEEELFSSQVNTGINFDKYDEIPVEVKGKDCPDPIQSFDELNFDKGSPMQKNIQRAKFSKPTPVQKHALPIVLNCRDLMACAQTGSGKTAAFLFPIIYHLLKLGVQNTIPQYQGYGSFIAKPQALILAPTRELSTQIYDEARKFTYQTGLRTVVLYGGADAKYQIQSLSKGCNILVATPGRLTDLMERGYVTLSDIKFLVLDEADRMLDMGFEPQIREIVEGEKMPPAGERQTLMFSATFPKDIQQLAREFLDNYIFLTFGKVGQAAELVFQKLEYVEEVEKYDELLNLVQNTKERVLVFVKMKKRADELEHFLHQNEIAAISIHGDKTQKEREYAIKNFKRGTRNVLVATDVAARGLDIDEISLVVNFDLPENVEDYVHRIGRTGRKGNEGFAISFFTEDNKNIAADLIKCLQDNKQQVPKFLHAHAEQKSKFSSSGYGSRRGGGGFGRGGGGFGRGGYNAVRGAFARGASSSGSKFSR